jgi:hypothetical protein
MNNRVEKIVAMRRIAVAAAEKELRSVVAGSFFKRQMQGCERYCLSRMRGGKQRQCYVPGKHAKAVELGARRYAKLMEFICEISDLNLELIKKGIGISD